MNRLIRLTGIFFVTPRDIDLMLNEVSKIIGYAISRWLYSELAIEEIARLVG